MDNKQTIIFLLKNRNKTMEKKFNIIDKLKITKFLLLYSKIHNLKEKISPEDIGKLNADLRVYDYIIIRILESYDKDFIIKELTDISSEIENIINKTDNNYSSALAKKEIKEKLRKYYYTKEEIENFLNEPTSEELEKELEHLNKMSNKIIKFSKHK